MISALQAIVTEVILIITGIGASRSFDMARVCVYVCVCVCRRVCVIMALSRGYSVQPCITVAKHLCACRNVLVTPISVIAL